jgi:hypothetical protein
MCTYSDFWIDENAIGAVRLPQPMANVTAIGPKCIVNTLKEKQVSVAVIEMGLVSRLLVLPRVRALRRRK